MDPFVVHFTASDPQPGSGIASVKAELDGQAVTNGQTVDLFGFSLGTHTLKVTATDNAGLTTVKTASFDVVTTLDGLNSTVERVCKEDGARYTGICVIMKATLAIAKDAQRASKTQLAIDTLKAFQVEVNLFAANKLLPSNTAKLLLADSDYVIKTLQATIPVLKKLSLTPLCSPDPKKSRVWSISNPNSVAVPFTWTVAGSKQAGAGFVLPASGSTPGTTNFTTQTESGVNTVNLFMNGVLQDSKASITTVCAKPKQRLAPTFVP